MKLLDKLQRLGLMGLHKIDLNSDYYKIQTSLVTGNDGSEYWMRHYVGRQNSAYADVIRSDGPVMSIALSNASDVVIDLGSVKDVKLSKYSKVLNTVDKHKLNELREWLDSMCPGETQILERYLTKNRWGPMDHFTHWKSPIKLQRKK